MISEAILLLYLIIMIGGWIWILYNNIRCRKMNNCRNYGCKFYDFCNHTAKTITDEEANELIELINNNFGGN